MFTVSAMPLYRFTAKFPAVEHIPPRLIRIALEPQQLVGRQPETIARDVFLKSGLSGNFSVEESPVRNPEVEAHIKSAHIQSTSNLDFRPRYKPSAVLSPSVTPDGTRYQWQQFGNTVVYVVVQGE